MDCGVGKIPVHMQNKKVMRHKGSSPCTMSPCNLRGCVYTISTTPQSIAEIRDHSHVYPFRNYTNSRQDILCLPCSYVVERVGLVARLNRFNKSHLCLLGMAKLQEQEDLLQLVIIWWMSSRLNSLHFPQSN